MTGMLGDGGDDFLTKDDERRFGEGLRRVLLSDNPNPERIGCPDPKSLRDIAFHKRIRNPRFVQEVTNHIARCSPCVRDSLAYAEEYKEHRRKQRANRLLAAVGAVLVLVALLWAA
jgi:hypothetical protein